MKIDIINLTKVKLGGYEIKKTCSTLFRLFKNNKTLIKSRSTHDDYSDLTVAIVSAEESRKMNKKFRNKNYPTDVLSFPPLVAQQGLGELVLCFAVLKKQAKKQNHSLKKEVQTMLVHGFLHLMGYDHEKSLKDEAVMMKIQNKIIKQLSGRKNVNRSRIKRFKKPSREVKN